MVWYDSVSIVWLGFHGLIPFTCMVQFPFHDMIPSPWYDPKFHSYVLCESISMVPFIWHDSNDMWDMEILAVLQIGGVTEGSG